MATAKRSTVIGTVVDTLTTEIGWTEDFPIQGGLHIYNNELKAHIDGQIVTVYPQAGGGTTEVVNISSAQILAMGTTPIELLPAAGANKYYDIEKVILEYTHVTTAYSSPDLVIKSNGSLWGFVYSQFVLLAGSESTVTFVNKPMDYNSTDFITTPYNFPLNTDLTIGTYDNSNPTLGDGTLRAIITYTLRTFGA
jgi:hypothetical protein